MYLPHARNTDIIVQSLGKEVLLYDLNSNKAYNLNETSAIVYQHCNGITTFADLKRKYHFTDDLIYFALDELKANNLIESEYQSAFAGVSRREAIRKVGMASMLALPIITSLVAPKAAQAQSCLPDNAFLSCTNDLGATCDLSPCCSKRLATGSSAACGNIPNGTCTCAATIPPP